MSVGSTKLNKGAQVPASPAPERETAEHDLTPHPSAETASLWCTCEKPLPVHLAERKGAARSVCARCERPLRLQLRSA